MTAIYQSIYIIILSIALIVSPNPALCAKILSIAFFYPSHGRVMTQVASQLQARGHSVVLVLASLNKAALDNEEIKFIIKYYSIPVTQQDINQCSAIALRNKDILLTPCYQLIHDDVRAFTSNKTFLDELKNDNFDAMVCDVSSFSCQVAAEYIDIKIQVDVSLFGFGDPLMAISFCIPSPLAYVRQLGLVSTHKMGLYHRTLNIILRYTMPFVINYLMFKPLRAAVNSTALGMHSVPDFEIKRSTFLLLNTDFAIETSRPITPAIKVVGPILAKPAKPLPPNLQQFIATNNKGTIIVSFGSVLSALKVLTDIQFFIDAFNRLPYNVLWKNTENSDYHIADSVKMVQWLPQNDLLGHPKVIAFITHCGLNSILEAAYHGVPMIAIPIVGDGFDHAQKVKAKNIGVVLDINNITSNILFNAIMQVTTDHNIIDSAKTISERIKNRPNNRTPVEETADWIEYALGNEGGGYLRSEEYKLNWYQLYLIDVFAVFLICAYIVLKLLKLISAQLIISCFN